MFEHTRGDDFSKAGVFRNSKTRLPIDLSDMEVFARVETPDQSWSEDLVATKLDQTSNTGGVVVASSASTDEWPIGTLRLVVWRVIDGKKRSLKSRNFSVVA